jgi:hypothetical protein
MCRGLACLFLVVAFVLGVDECWMVWGSAVGRRRVEGTGRGWARQAGEAAERFTAVVTQVGDANLDVRLGGISRWSSSRVPPRPTRKPGD